MYIPEKMKVNKFVAVDVPSPRTMFVRVGAVVMPEKDYSGDDLVPEQMRKVDSISDYERYAEQMAREAVKKTDDE